MHTITARNFRSVYAKLLPLLRDETKKVDSGTWQSVPTAGKPEMITYELEDVILNFPLFIEGLDYHRLQVGPNLPWADDHFEKDRVSGQPLNPGFTWEQWPYSNKANSFRDENGQFNHSYAERYWPKYAGVRKDNEGVPSAEDVEIINPARGIRYPYGDLEDVVNLLVANPGTRGAYLPVWFPEDTGIVHGGRTPCSIGYLFRMRDNRLSVFYDIRSCDVLRHFKDDVYLTIRLLLWVLDQCRSKDETWKKIAPGDFTMHIGSLHFFMNDRSLVLG